MDLALSSPVFFFFAPCYLKYGLNLNRWDTNSAGRANHDSPWKFISQGLSSFSCLLSLFLGDGSRVNFGKIFGLIICFSLRLPQGRLFRLSSLHYALVCQFYSAFSSTPAGIFVFHEFA